MNESDRRSLREAAGQVEAAESRVIGLIGLAAESGYGKDRMAADEMAELHEISANLRAACTRMWSLSDR
jgi:hypothetical protein